MRRRAAGQDAFDPGDGGDALALGVGGHGDLVVLGCAREALLDAAQALHEGGHVNKKGQVTIPKHIRVAAGVLPGSEVTFAIEAGNIVISKLASGIKTDRREQLRAAAAKVHQSMGPALRQMPAADVMAFLRADAACAQALCAAEVSFGPFNA